MLNQATVYGRGHEAARALLSVVVVVMGTWLSGVVDRPAGESDVREAIGDTDGVWTWVAEAPGEEADVGNGDPVVSHTEGTCELNRTDGSDELEVTRASARWERVEARQWPQVMVPLRDT